MSWKACSHVRTRWLSSGSVANQSILGASVQHYVTDPVKLIAIPITTHKLFVYHKHMPRVLNVGSRLVKYEARALQKAAKIWAKLEKSQGKLNQKVVGFVNLMLDKTPWTEDSLNTIPSENYIMKRVKENEDERLLTLEEWLKDASTLNVRPIHLYYPESVCSPDTVRQQLQSLWMQGLQYHKKQTWLSLLGIPLTLPLVLVPVVPNVPGFYLLYRAYRNFKAYCGAKHLKSLVEHKSHKLLYTNLPQYSDLLAQRSTGGAAERLVLTENDLERVLDTLEIHEMRSSLRKALQQERRRLEGPSEERNETT
ncbi:LADA_0F13344g1_1 [Lachancea dasiensis]|uniref:LADA_0F13344g1_1 n=1 Tax=Lachancea dasiensis TaxID=1072105 RepID=A0A1G4JMT2_9SACH|nr:LADA_0F13344g1_1 [Lachancea dasiensis]